MEVTFPKCELIFFEVITLEALTYRFVMCVNNRRNIMLYKVALKYKKKVMFFICRIVRFPH
jgi:hypothetical protein